MDNDYLSSYDEPPEEFCPFPIDDSAEDIVHFTPKR
jgi:hypothetical protein